MKLRISAPNVTLHLTGNEGQQKLVSLSGTSIDGSVIQATASGDVAVELDQVISGITSGGIGLQDVFLELDGGWAKDVFQITQFMVLKGAALELTALKKKACEARKVAEQLISAGKIEAAAELLMSFAGSVFDHTTPAPAHAPDAPVAKVEKPAAPQAPAANEGKKPVGFAAFATPSKTPEVDTIELDDSELQAVAAEKKEEVVDAPKSSPTPKPTEEKAADTRVPAFGSF